MITNSAFAADQPGLIPIATNWVSQIGGYSVTIIGYDPSYQWTFTPSSGQYYFDGQHVVTVTGAIGGISNSLIITTSKPGFTTQRTMINGYVAGIPLNYKPLFQTVSQTQTGFTVQILNFDPTLIWSWAVNNGSISSNNSGLLTVSNLKRGQQTTISIHIGKPGYDSADFQFIQTSQPPPLNLVPVMGQLTANSSTVTVPVTNFDSYFDWSVSTTSGTANIDKNTGVVTVNGLNGTQVAKLTVTDSHNGQIIGQSTSLVYLSPTALSVKPQFDTPVTGLRGFQAKITNFNSVFNWTANSSIGSASIDSDGLLTVSNMQPGQSATVNVTSFIQGATPTTSSITAASWPAQGLDLQIQEPHQTADGFNFKISDFNKFYDYQGTTNVGVLNLSSGGFGVVTGLTGGQKAHVTITVGKNGQGINTVEFDSAAVLEVTIAQAPDVADSTPKSPTKSSSSSGGAKKPLTSQTKAPTKVQIVQPSKPVITIICLKGSSHKFVTAASPKCPIGFTQQK